MLIEKDYVEMLIGLGHCPLENPERAAVDYVENSWILALAKFLQRCGGSILTNTKRVVEKQRDNDVFLMDHAGMLSAGDRMKIQECRLFLQVMTIGDISNVEGTYLDKRVLRGVQNRKK